MTGRRGLPGEEGHPGKPGEKGKDTGEGGRGGEGGEGGVGGAGAPQGPGGGGGPGGVGGRGARGAQGPAGERGPAGNQPRLRWAPAVGYLLLALVLGFLIWRTHDLAQDNRRLGRAQAEQAYQDCLDRNQRTTAAGKALAKLIAANKADGNPHAAAVWAEFVAASKRTPLPACTPPDD
jgi:hypothetical protein